MLYIRFLNRLLLNYAMLTSWSGIGITSPPAPNHRQCLVHADSQMKPLPHETAASGQLPEWRIATGTVAYPDAVSLMEERVEAISQGLERELVWLLEHPPIYTAGTSAIDSDLINARFPVFKTGRGGQFTYHGPGQRVGYVMLDLRSRKADVRKFVRDLEEWLIRALQTFDVKGERRSDRVGIWIVDGGTEKKIAAIGVRLRRWITYHGISLNVAPDLSHFSGIIPCGVREHGVTSLKALGINVEMKEVDTALKNAFEEIFGPVH
jgi:lipoyl(octanoyl) transferase